MFLGETPETITKFLELPSVKMAIEEGRKDLAEVLIEVLQRIVPSEDEERQVRELAETLRLEVQKALEDIGVPASVEIEGSVARGTWISKSVDFDIFVLLPPPPTTEYKLLLENLIVEIMRRLNMRGQLRYAEHPYLHIWFDSFEADIVPAFKSHPESIISAVDRTPYHTRYVQSMLNESLRNEIRLFKTFLRGIGVYGAEIKVGGFSGYACELLVIYYGSFLRAIRELSRNKRIFIDLTRTWSLKDALKKFNQPFIIIDPVDRNRNVTSALREETIYKFQLMSKLFLSKPNIGFFFPRPLEVPTNDLLLHEISRRKFCMIVLRKSSAPPDVYWGQALRVLHKIKNLLDRSEFFPLFLGISEGEQSVIILIETKFHETPTPKKVVGPPIYADTNNILSFIQKYRNKSIAGPWIENSRLVFLVDERTRLDDFLKEYIETIRIEPSFASFEIVTSPSEILDIARREGILEDFYSLVKRREILSYINS